MWKKSFFWFLFSLLTLKAELDSETMKKTNKCTSPSLYSETNIVVKGQNVSLSCSHQNQSLKITLFREKNCIGTIQESKGKPVIFNLSISEARDLGPYKCKAVFSNCTTYSPEFNFTIVDPVTTPVLKIVIQKQPNLYITLSCISFNGSLPINYTFFKKGIALSPVISKHVREPAEFDLTKSNTREGEEYSCEAKNSLPDYARRSHPATVPSTSGDGCPLCLQLLLPLLMLIVILLLAFWIRQKYKARKAMRNKAPRDYGNTPTEVGIYANVHEDQADKESVPGVAPRQCVFTAQEETEHSHEIHYATPMFLEVIPEVQNDDKTRCVYAELSL
ncbi:allergin-1 [Pipistrellus kuhlii]|uniref:allergin-1 n=1 Tax=Pipistrellus kuhlii TaxID=59472 RepID=UPI00174F3D54|nr:allergin-1 [Pipistrellus kuhlii]XP_036307416.1 allergin-1 [Pipistrellus kuhlii]